MLAENHKRPVYHRGRTGSIEPMSKKRYAPRELYTILIGLPSLFNGKDELVG